MKSNIKWSNCMSSLMPGTASDCFQYNCFSSVEMFADLGIMVIKLIGRLTTSYWLSPKYVIIITTGFSTCCGIITLYNRLEIVEVDLHWPSWISLFSCQNKYIHAVSIFVKIDNIICSILFSMIYEILLLVRLEPADKEDEVYKALLSSEM